MSELVSTTAREFLERGDIAGLLRHNASRYGNATMTAPVQGQSSSGGGNQQAPAQQTDQGQQSQQQAPEGTQGQQGQQQQQAPVPPWVRDGVPLDNDRAQTYFTNLANEIAALKAQNGELTNKANEAERAKMSENDRLKADLAQAQAQANQATIELTKVSVLTEKKVPQALWRFVGGTDKASIEASAADVLTAFSGQNTTQNDQNNSQQQQFQQTPIPQLYGTGLVQPNEVAEFDPAKLANQYGGSR